MKKFVITITILAALLVAADFGTRIVAQEVVTSRIEQQTGSRVQVGTRINGVSMLWQLITGRYDSVVISAAGIERAPLTNVTAEVDLRDLDLPLDSVINGTVNNATVSEALVRLTVPTDEIAAATGIDGLSVTGADRDGVEFSYTAQAFGQKLTFGIKTRVEIQDNKLVFVPTQAVSPAGDVPVEQVMRLLGAPDIEIPLSNGVVNFTSGSAQVENGRLVLAAVTGRVSLGDLADLTTQ